MKKENKRGNLSLDAKSFLTAILVVFFLMVFSYILTFLIPGGEYAKTPDANGNTVIDTVKGFSFKEGGIPFWKWLLSPFLVLSAEGGGTIIAIIAFLLVVGGVFTCLEDGGLMRYMLHKIVHRFQKTRYRLLAVIVFFFMAMGAFIGSFEECVPLVPLVVALALRFNWDAETGVGMSLLATGCGFASGVCNPFTTGIAQSLSGLPMFSGLWLRLLSFILIYILLFLFLFFHVKKLEKNNPMNEESHDYIADKKMDKGILSFCIILGSGILLVLFSGFIKALQDYTMIIIAVMFLTAGLVSSSLSGMRGKKMAISFKNGLVSIFPAVLLVLMASSVKYTLTEASILDTILYYGISAANGLPKWLIILFIYFLVLIMDFFVSSGSAKAFLLIPLITPMAQLFGINAQLCVLAFAFGDGFSNVFYPTNAALLISLSLANLSFGKWIRFSWKFQIINLLMTSLLLLFGLFTGYG